MSNLRRTSTAVVFVCLLALPAAAKPASDGPFETLRSKITRIVKAVVRVVLPISNDEPQPPKP